MPTTVENESVWSQVGASVSADFNLDQESLDIVNQALEDAPEDFGSVAASTGAVFTTAFTGWDEEEREKLGEATDAVGAAAKALTEQKTKEFLARLAARRTVTIKALVGEIGAGAIGLQETVANGTLAKKLTKTIAKASADLIYDYGEAIVNDPEFREAIGSLQLTQDLLALAEDISDLVNTVYKIAKWAEPYVPIVECIVALALIAWSGGSSIKSATSTAGIAFRQKLRELVALIAKPIKDAIYNAEVEVPEVILGFSGYFATDSARQKFQSKVGAIETAMLIDDAWYNTTMESLEFTNAYSDLLNGNPSTMVALGAAGTETPLAGGNLTGRDLRFQPTELAESFQTIQTIASVVDEALKNIAALKVVQFAFGGRDVAAGILYASSAMSYVEASISAALVKSLGDRQDETLEAIRNSYRSSEGQIANTLLPSTITEASTDQISQEFQQQSSPNGQEGNASVIAFAGFEDSFPADLELTFGQSGNAQFDNNALEWLMQESLMNLLSRDEVALNKNDLHYDEATTNKIELL